MAVGDEECHFAEDGFDADAAVGFGGASDFDAGGFGVIGGDGAAGEIQELLDKFVGLVG